MASNADNSFFEALFFGFEKAVVKLSSTRKNIKSNKTVVFKVILIEFLIGKVIKKLHVSLHLLENGTMFTTK
ncbi:hypothetical protein TRFO_38351 [Tritrichomonas foetus]|uniref:Uncharacterized protein n=1 Tax=Tritrichomonas foetus TaxID=1144522 RepID=A0A1J4J8P6_9EUKA|nr:hypothetical protein TRFO_38351 [Tritrichomonas foetus]|eukprot:OHS95512.1 hypothetical protein TRFO_38351 [Tritrichomonas foetus]